MGRRGFQPAPTALKVLKGERPDRINHDEPQPRDGLPACPPGVSKQVKEIWDYTIAELAQMRVITPADRDGLVAYCEAVALHRQASAVVASAGHADKALNGGHARHPAIQVQREAAATMRAWAQEFGLTPAARTGIKVAATTERKVGAARLLSG